MAASGGYASEDLPGWRLSLLLVGFLILSLLAEKFLHWLHHALSGRAGLSKALESLKTELLLLGVLSLLLVPLTKPLSAICIPSGKSDYSTEKGDDYKKGYGSRRLLLHRLHPITLMHLGRSLLAGNCNSPCGKGEEPFWTAAAIHDTHLLLFFAAVIYIVYTSLTLVICLWQVHRWRAWEDKLREGPGDWEVDPRLVHMLGQNPFSHWVRAFMASFTSSVTNPVYANIRNLFLQQMNFDNSYDFQSLVQLSIEGQLAGCFKTEWVMWLYAAVLVAMPSFVLAAVWTAIISMLLMAVMGAKLTSIAVRLSVPADRRLLQERLETQLVASVNTSQQAGKSGLEQSNLPDASKDVLPTPRGMDKGVKLDMDCLKNAVGKDKDKGSPRLEPPSLGRPSLGRLSLGRRSVKSVGSARSIAGGSTSAADYSDSETASRTPSAMWNRLAYTSKPFTAYAYTTPQDQKQVIQRLVKRMERQRTRLLRAQGDAQSLFWWRRPKLLLQVFRFILFQNAMNITLVGFSLLKDYRNRNQDPWGFAKIPKWLVAILFVVDVLLLVHAAWYVLPQYALLELVGSHCPKKVLTKAVKYAQLRDIALETLRVVDEHHKPGKTVQKALLSGGEETPRQRSSILKSLGGAVNPFNKRQGVSGNRQTESPDGTPHAAKSAKSTEDHLSRETLLGRLLMDMHKAHRKKQLGTLVAGHLEEGETSDAAHTQRPDFARKSLPDLAIRSIQGHDLPPALLQRLDPILQVSIQRRAMSIELQRSMELQRSPQGPPQQTPEGIERLADTPKPKGLATLSPSHSTPLLLHLLDDEEAGTTHADLFRQQSNMLIKPQTSNHDQPHGTTTGEGSAGSSRAAASSVTLDETDVEA